MITWGSVKLDQRKKLTKNTLVGFRSNFEIYLSSKNKNWLFSLIGSNFIGGGKNFPGIDYGNFPIFGCRHSPISISMHFMECTPPKTNTTMANHHI